MPTCPVCGQDNPAIARYCLACGTPLEGGSGRREERKVVTALFCDLVGFTSRSEVSDPEEVRAMLRAYYFRVRELIEHFGGTVEKFIGDAVVAVFGAPVAHEDDPERALHAAFRVLGAIALLRDEWPGFDLAVRIGVNTGETLVTPAAAEAGEGLATGDVMNTAAIATHAFGLATPSSNPPARDGAAAASDPAVSGGAVAMWKARYRMYATATPIRTGLAAGTASSAPVTPAATPASTTVVPRMIPAR
jgi:hypothetical protein